MCLISDKIRFCTCSDSSYENLSHYWVLHRHNPEKDLGIIGEAMIPHHLFQPNFELDQNTLANRLNECDAFDMEMEFKPNDKIEIVFNNLLEDAKRLVFCFQFKKGKWAAVEYDVFELANNYDELSFGKMRKSLEKETM